MADVLEVSKDKYYEELGKELLKQALKEIDYESRFDMFTIKEVDNYPRFIEMEGLHILFPTKEKHEEFLNEVDKEVLRLIKDPEYINKLQDD